MDDPITDNQDPKVETPVTPETPVEPTPVTPEVPVVDDGEPEIDKVVEPKKDSDGEPEEFDPYDADKMKGYISKEINKAKEPVEEMLFKQTVDTKLNQILGQNPEFAPYKAKIEKWVNHPNRLTFIKQGLPLKAVVMEAIADDLQRIGAEKAKKADADANATKTGGTTPPVREAGAVDYNKMTPAQIERMAEDAKAGRFMPQ